MDEVAQVREKIDLVALISEHIPLKKMGRNFKGLCPFHNEKTPSFVVSPERQIWHCFGCTKGGDCYSFLMELEHMEFPEALRTLARRAGVQLIEKPFQSSLTSQKEKIYKLNKLASEFYHYILTKHNAGKRALSYISKGRGVHDRVIETFRLGFAPGVSNALSKYLLEKKQYKAEDLVQAGLGMQKGRVVVDFFVNRIIFPIIDHRSNVIAFSGRSMSDAAGSKYVNTRDTLVYHKGDTLFGLNVTKDAIKEENKALIMEGEFDVISSFQEGINNAVAVKGTALTDHQIQLLSRFCQRVSLCFDFDKAGQDALKRSVPLLEKRGLQVSVVQIGEGKDPDEAIRHDPVSFKKAVEKDTGIYDFLLDQVLTMFDKATAEGKQRISQDLLPTLGAIENEIIKEHFLKKLAKELDTSYESIIKQLERMQKKESVGIQLVRQPKDTRKREEILEEYLLALILQAGSNVGNIFAKAKETVGDFWVDGSSCKKIADHLDTYLQQSALFTVKHFFKTLPAELLPTADRCFLFPLPPFEKEAYYEREVLKAARELKELTVRSHIKSIGEAIQKNEAQSGGLEDSRELQSLRAHLSQLISLLGK